MLYRGTFNLNLGLENASWRSWKSEKRTLVMWEAEKKGITQIYKQLGTYRKVKRKREREKQREIRKRERDNL
jgi:hypothetical protein